MSIGPKTRDYNVILNGTTSLLLSYDKNYWSVVSGPSVVTGARTSYLTVSNPWRERKPLTLTPTSRTLLYRATTHCYGDARWKDGVSYIRQIGYITGPGIALQGASYGVSEKTRLVNEAVLDALKKLKNQDFNAGVAIAESEGVARMLVDAVSTVHDTLEALHQRKFVEAYRRWRKSRMGRRYRKSYRQWREQYWEEIRHVASVRRAGRIPEGWLYYHYGIKPTIDDLIAACNDLAVDRQNPDLMNGVIMGYAKNAVKSRVPYSGGNVYADLVLSSLESVRVYLKVAQKSAFGAKLSSLGVTNLPEAIWNRGPFTFVVDYFFSVGDYLSVMDSGVGWEFGDSVECYRRVKTGVAQPNTKKSGTYFLTVTPGRWTEKTITRTVKTALYSPMFSVLPSLKLRNPSVTQIANMLSLVATGFKRTVRP